jgi:hypothetical protein
VKIYASTPRQLVVPLAVVAVLLVLLGIFTVLPWLLLVALFLVAAGYFVLVMRRTWVHLGAGGVAWRTPRRFPWATPTGSAVRDQIRGFDVSSAEVGRVVRLSLADGSFVVLPIWESTSQPSEQFGRLTRDLGRSYSRL